MPARTPYIRVRSPSKCWAYTLDEGTISSFQIVREPHRQAEHPQFSIDGLQTDRAFYTVKQDGGYRLRGALVTHYMNDASYAVETRRIDGTDYGVTLPTATFNVARMNGATLIYWLESCSAPEGKTGSYYRVCGTFYDAKKDIMTSRLVLAEINAGDKIPMNLQMTSKGQAYYVLCRKDEQEGATDSSYMISLWCFRCILRFSMCIRSEVGDFLYREKSLCKASSTPRFCRQIHTLFIMRSVPSNISAIQTPQRRKKCWTILRNTCVPIQPTSQADH